MTMSSSFLSFNPASLSFLASFYSSSIFSSFSFILASLTETLAKSVAALDFFSNSKILSSFFVISA